MVHVCSSEHSDLSFVYRFKVAFHFRHLFSFNSARFSVQESVIGLKIAHRINKFCVIKLYAHVYTSCMEELNINLLPPTISYHMRTGSDLGK